MIDDGRLDSTVRILRGCFELFDALTDAYVEAKETETAPVGLIPAVMGEAEPAG